MSKTSLQSNEAEKNVPAILGAVGVVGLEELDSGDITLPRAKLLQGSCSEVKNPDQYPNLRVGMLINTITKEPLQTVDEAGKKVYPFIPVKMFKSWIRFNGQKDKPDFDPNYEPGAIIAQSYDKSSKLATCPDNWMYRQTNFMGFQPGTRTPIVLTFAKTSAKTGKDLINFISLAGRALYEHTLYVGSKTEEKDNNTYMVLTAKSVGKPEAKDLSTAVQMYREFNPILSNLKSQTAVQIHDDVEELEVVTDKPGHEGQYTRSDRWDD